MELVVFEELIEDDASRGQAVVRVVLEVSVAVLVSADLLSAEAIVFALDPAASVLTPFLANLFDNVLKAPKELRFNLVH